jgi:SAM-dependent methyltransferase
MEYVYKRRISVPAIGVRNSSINSKVLDVGCGVATSSPHCVHDGHFSSGIDVQLRFRAAIHVERFDGKSIPYGQDSFDVVMFIDVLHHTNSRSVCFAKRSCARAILIEMACSKGLRLFDSAVYGLGRECASRGSLCPTLLDVGGMASGIQQGGTCCHFLGRDPQTLSISGRSDL